MAMTSQAIFSLILVLSTSFFLLLHPCDGHSLKICSFDQIYQLGDSISDTGNLIREPVGATNSACGRLPYGETFFNRATGRCSNGQLMIDFIATAAGLPFLDAYKDNDGDFTHGVNFAVAGSTALSVDSLAKRNITITETNSSLGVQLVWMSKHFDSICNTTRDCVEKFKDSLLMVGEIGGNDINGALLQEKSIEEVKSLVPCMVQAIENAVRIVISYGAVRVVVPGNFPIGCFPMYLTRFKTNKSTAYDEHKCLKDLNELSKFQNKQLRQAIRELKKEFPNVVIAYGDYYKAFEWLYKNADSLGFDTSAKQQACCGSGGDYNFNLTRLCGAQDVPVCQNSDQLISWDGIHMTQEANKHMAAWLVDDLLPKLHCSS